MPIYSEEKRRATYKAWRCHRGRLHATRSKGALGRNTQYSKYRQRAPWATTRNRRQIVGRPAAMPDKFLSRYAGDDHASPRPAATSSPAALP